jgi:sodium transport system ATP-binding protein
MIEARRLAKHFGAVQAVRQRVVHARPTARSRRSSAQRRRQDHDAAHDLDAGRADAGQGAGRRHRRRRRSLAVRARLGVLSDARGLYGRLTARENIAYYGALRGLAPAAVEAAIGRLAEWLDLGALLERRTDGFSQGERMKVAIARALVHDPPNVMLDEPTNGLDVMTTRSLREVVRRLREAGKCVLFSSHVMQEVSALCDTIVIVARGAVVASGTSADLLAASGRDNLEDAFVHLSGAEAA